MKQLHKHDEELCGDSVAISRHSDTVTLALSDGLGSGVKANILATLTTRIAMHMLENELPLTEVVETLGQTLPVCRVRKLAYSTFAIAKFMRNGHSRIVEFDTPRPIVLRDRKLLGLVSEERVISDKTIRDSEVELKQGDWVIFVSDGVLNAGIGGCYPLGWGWDQIVSYLEQHAHEKLSASDLAQKLTETVANLYSNSPGDDVSVIVIKVRRELSATVLAGPPESRDSDQSVLKSFLQRPGLHIVCGGTTSKMVAAHLGQPLEVDLKTMKFTVPPLARIKNMDLVTEGILTLTVAAELLQSGANKDTVKFGIDGASALVRMLLQADDVHFIVGLGTNPAHQNPNLPSHVRMKLSVVREIADELQNRGAEVTMESV